MYLYIVSYCAYNLNNVISTIVHPKILTKYGHTNSGLFIILKETVFPLIDTIYWIVSGNNIQCTSDGL